MAAPLIAERFLTRLAAAAERVARTRAQICEAAELKEPRREVLDALRLRGDRGCSQTELSAALQLAESSVCGLVDRMQREGLLYRFRAKSDRRKSLLVATHAGRSRLEAVRRATEALIMEWLDNSDDAELERIGTWLDGLAPESPGEVIAELLRRAAATPPATPSEWKEAG